MKCERGKIMYYELETKINLILFFPLRTLVSKIRSKILILALDDLSHKSVIFSVFYLAHCEQKCLLLYHFSDWFSFSVLGENGKINSI